jgi:Asp-tRNA(Asn)/Glu-tRNA(Gln) amidotransferase A subunit family amidase
MSLKTRDRLNAFLDQPEVPVDSATSGPLAGLTLGVKDIFDVKGYVTGWGNPDRFEEAEPAESSAPAVQKLLDAGARFIGKTQTEELAFSMIGQNRTGSRAARPPVRRPQWPADWWTSARDPTPAALCGRRRAFAA